MDSDVYDDPLPELNPNDFIKELVDIILAERNLRGILPEAMCSLDLRYDNSYIGGLLSDTNLSERIMMETKCPVLAKNYMRPIGKDFPDLKQDKYRLENYGPSFDPSAEVLVAHFANVGVAFKLTPIDEWGVMMSAT